MMCWKYEDIYPGQCWDLLEKGVFWSDDAGDGSLPAFLSEFCGITVVNRDAFLEAFFKMCETLHEVGIIRPADKEVKAQ
mgnify:CR=1 FL=1